MYVDPFHTMCIRWSWRPEEDLRSRMGAGKQTWAPWEQREPITTEPSLQSPALLFSSLRRGLSPSPLVSHSLDSPADLGHAIFFPWFFWIAEASHGPPSPVGLRYIHSELEEGGDQWLDSKTLKGQETPATLFLPLWVLNALLPSHTTGSSVGIGVKVPVLDLLDSYNKILDLVICKYLEAISYS